ncbi:MAG TPA: DUF6636 domain-containing protein [Thermoleophilaceae bacterium]|jgi:hypothetical protein|nr:DUF6636 domain-containing protein [Thermoleophilaceae bacterium]
MRSLLAVTVVVAALAAASPASAAVFFHSPSNNIRCVIQATQLARCDITERDWTPPPKPASCPGDWANGLQVGRHGRGRFTCVTDAVDGGKALPYGESIERGRFRCTSRRAGMRCVNKRTHHGFGLSRQRARRF